MNVIPTDFGKRSSHLAEAQQRVAPAPHQDLAPDPDLAAQWAALHQAAIAIAQLAGPAAIPTPPGFSAFPESMHAVTGWRFVLFEQGIADLVAIMEPGLTALLNAHARGADPAAAAAALWQEFITARSGLLALVPPDADGPENLVSDA